MSLHSGELGGCRQVLGNSPPEDGSIGHIRGCGLCGGDTQAPPAPSLCCSQAMLQGGSQGVWLVGWEDSKQHRSLPDLLLVEQIRLSHCHLAWPPLAQGHQLFPRQELRGL